MTRTTREIEKAKNDNLVTLSFTLFSILLIIVSLGYTILQGEIKQLPHKYCHDKTKVTPTTLGELTVTNHEMWGYLTNRSFGELDKLLKDEGIFCEFGDSDKCVIITQNQVCEIK